MGIRASASDGTRRTQGGSHDDDATHDTSPGQGVQRSPPIVTLPSPKKLAWNLLHNEGDTTTVNRLQLIERTMYGRAGFELLRKKALYQPARAQPDHQQRA